jgi:uncharacterized protein
VTRYLDMLIDTMMVRCLEPHLANVGKRLVKSPKVYLRDSGLLHALLGISTVTELQGHPIAGASWEGFVVEQIAALAPQGSPIGFYRTASGAEIDVVLTTGSRRMGSEMANRHRKPGGSSPHTVTDRTSAITLTSKVF